MSPSFQCPQPFNYELDFKRLDFRQQRELYRVGKGEQGALRVEPYKSEILSRWRFKTVAEAKEWCMCQPPNRTPIGNNSNRA